MTKSEEASNSTDYTYSYRHDQFNALPIKLREAFATFSQKMNHTICEKQSDPTNRSTCKFNPGAKLLTIKIDQSVIPNKVELNELSFEMCNTRFVFVLDVSGSMGKAATDMVDVLIQIEGELDRLMNIADVSILFFSHELIEVPVGEISSVKRRAGWMGCTNFIPPMEEILRLSKQDPNIKNKVLFMTDGNSHYDWRQVVKEIHSQPNIDITSIGFGSSVSIQSLGDIATTHGSVHNLAGTDCKSKLHDLLQTSACLDMRCFPGVVTTPNGTKHTINFYPYSMENDTVGLQASMYLPNGTIADGSLICYEVNGIVEVLTVENIQSSEPDRYPAALAMKSALDTIVANNVLTKEDGHTIRELDRQLIAFSACDRRCAQINATVGSIKNLIETGGIIGDAKPIFDRMSLFVNSLASGALVSGRQGRTINKAAKKTSGMLQYMQAARDDIMKTHDIELTQRTFGGEDLLLASVETPTKQYPFLLLPNSKNTHQTPSDFENFVKSTLANSIQLVQPASLPSPLCAGFIFPSEFDVDALPSSLQCMLNSIFRCEMNTMACVGQSSSNDFLYTTIMFRIYASMLSLGIITKGPDSVCWNLASAGMEVAANIHDKSPLVMTTIMSYFYAYFKYLHKNNRFESTTEHFRNVVRFFACSTSPTVLDKYENIWMAIGPYYCLPRCEMGNLFHKFSHSIISECVRQALNASQKTRPSSYRDLQNIFTSSLSYRGVLYNDTGESADCNKNSWLWSTDVSVFAQHKDFLSENFQSILSSIKTTKGKTEEFNMTMNKMLKFQYPFEASYFDLTKENVEKIVENILGDAQNRRGTAPHWLSSRQICDLLNTLHFMFSSENDYRFGYISPDVCARISSHKYTHLLTDMYTTIDELILHLLFLTSTGGLNSNIRASFLPTCKSDLAPLIPPPSQVGVFESKRAEQFALNIINWSIIDKWHIDTIVQLFSVARTICNPRDIVDMAYSVSRSQSNHNFFITIITSHLDPGCLEVGSITRCQINDYLSKPLLTKYKDNIMIDLDNRFKQSLPTPSVLCSRNFNRDMASMIRESLKILSKELTDGVFTVEMLDNAKKISPSPALRKGCAYYLKLFQKVSFVVKDTNDGGKVFIDKIGDHIERRKLDIPRKILHETASNKTIRVYIWGVSLQVEASNFMCKDQVMIKAQMQNIRDHYATVKIPLSCITNSAVCYPYESHIVKYYDSLISKISTLE